MLRRRPYYFFSLPIERKDVAKISPAKRFACPVTQLLKRPAKNALKCLILKTLLCQHLLLSMSSSLTSVDLSNADCKRGQVSQWPLISYVQSKSSSTTLIVSRETIKIKTPKGESKQAVLGNKADREEYGKHLKAFFWYAENLGHEAKLESAEKATQAAYRNLKKIRGEKPQDPTAKTKWLKKVKVEKAELEKAKIAESTITGPAYDLFRKLLRDNPETQWDWSVSKMHLKNPWEDLTGYKRVNLCPKSYASLIECIE